ncbi:MAG: glycosyltransferase family 4 protein [Candidatus Dormibacteraceae bacterium]
MLDDDCKSPSPKAGKVTTVAVDANPMSRPLWTGTERYAAEVCRRLPDLAPDLHFRFYASRPTPRLDSQVLRGSRLWSQLRLPLELWLRVPDLLFVPAHVVPFASPGRTLTTIHDLAFERFPDAYQPNQRRYLRLTTKWAGWRCKRVIAVSQATANDLVELYGVPPSKITVVYPGSDDHPHPMKREVAHQQLERLGLNRPFVLQIGRIEKRKNQLSALRAAERLPELDLVLAGAINDSQLAGELAQSERCRILGPVDEIAREALYQQAEALIFPSLYEGFGFPIIEAMQRGLPVVTAANSSLPEVGGDAALYAQDPLDPAELAELLERAINERADLAVRGYQQAAKFSWKRSASEIVQVMRDIVE